MAEASGAWNDELDSINASELDSLLARVLAKGGSTRHVPLVLGSSPSAATRALASLRRALVGRGVFVAVPAASDPMASAVAGAARDLGRRTPSGRPQLAAIVDRLIETAGPFVLHEELASVQGSLTPDALDVADQVPAVLSERFVPELGTVVPGVSRELFFALCTERVRSGDGSALAKVGASLGATQFFHELGTLASRLDVPLVVAFEPSEASAVVASAAASLVHHPGVGLVVGCVTSVWEGQRDLLHDAERDLFEPSRVTTRAFARAALAAGLEASPAQGPLPATVILPTPTPAAPGGTAWLGNAETIVGASPTPALAAPSPAPTTSTVVETPPTSPKPTSPAPMTATVVETPATSPRPTTPTVVAPTPTSPAQTTHPVVETPPTSTVVAPKPTTIAPAPVGSPAPSEGGPLGITLGLVAVGLVGALATAGVLVLGFHAPRHEVPVVAVRPSPVVQPTLVVSPIPLRLPSPGPTPTPAPSDSYLAALAAAKTAAEKLAVLPRFMKKGNPMFRSRQRLIPRTCAVVLYCVVFLAIDLGIGAPIRTVQAQKPKEQRKAESAQAVTVKELFTLTHASIIHAVAFSADGKRIITGSDDYTAKIWDVQTGRELLTLDLSRSAESENIVGSVQGAIFRGLIGVMQEACYNAFLLPSQSQGCRMPHGPEVWSVAFSPDGRRIVTGSTYNVTVIWDAQTGKEIRTFQLNRQPTVWSNVVVVAFAPDGKHLVTGSCDSETKVWNARTGRLIHTLQGGMYAAYSRDGNRIATASLDTMKVWNAQTGKAILTLKDTGNSIAVALSPDGKRIVTGNQDHMAKVWDAQTGRLILTLKGHRADVDSVAYTPDGKYIVTGSDDQTAKVWNARTGQEIRTLIGHTDRVYSVAISPDGKHIVTGSSDNTAKVWLLTEESGSSDGNSLGRDDRRP